MSISLHVLKAEKEQKLIVKEQQQQSASDVGASLANFRLLSFVIVVAAVDLNGLF